MYYDYESLMHDIERFTTKGLETGVIGSSFQGRQIPYVFLGKKDDNCILIHGGIHAREHITSKLVCALAEYLSNDIKSINGGIYFVPMVNPDGVELSLHGLPTVSDMFTKQFLLDVNNYSSDFSMFKSNANAVDLNVNFDALWGTGEQNVFCPSPANYIGEYPVSELESKALCNFTMENDIRGTISYHAKGEVIFWDFHQGGERFTRDRSIGKILSSVTGYPLQNSGNSAGGYKDWCITSLYIPAYTIEVGNDAKDYLEIYEDFDNILKRNKDVPQVLLNEINEINESLQAVY